LAKTPKIDFTGVSGNVTFMQEALARPDGEAESWVSVLWATRAEREAVEVVAHFSLNDYRFASNAHKDQCLRDALAAELDNGWSHFMVFVQWENDRPHLSDRIPIHARIVETIDDGPREGIH
jgi:hypothetical protein